MDVPPHVRHAAQIVAKWLDQQPDKYGITICGLQVRHSHIYEPVQRRVSPEAPGDPPTAPEPFAYREL